MKKTKSPAGRKPLPQEQKKKAVTIYLDGETIDRNGGINQVKLKMYDAIK